MNIPLNSEVTAEGPHQTYRKSSGQSQDVVLDTVVPEAARELADRTVAETRETHERSKDALEAALQTVDRSYDALGQGVAALNRKIIEIAQRNISSGFDLAKGLATAKTLAEIVVLRATYWAQAIHRTCGPSRGSPCIIRKGGRGDDTPNRGTRSAHLG